MHPHDYYAPYSDEPHLHNRGGGRPYVEPDWQAHLAGHQLPVLSTVGRGPRGEGLQVGDVVSEEGLESFALYSTLTGEKVWQSPNLAPGAISFDLPDFEDLAAGTPAPFRIIWSRSGHEDVYHGYLPAGQQGSFIYILPGKIQRNATGTYQTTMGDLVIYNNESWPNHKKPNARVNDIVMCSVTDDDGEYLVVGDIVNVGSHNNEEITESTPVQFAVRTMISSPVQPAIGSDKTNVVRASLVLQKEEDPYSPGQWKVYSSSQAVFLCHVSSLEEFLPRAPIYWESNDAMIPGMSGLVAEGLDFGIYVVPLEAIFTEAPPFVFAYKEANGGYDIYGAVSYKSWELTSSEELADEIIQAGVKIIYSFSIVKEFKDATMELQYRWIIR